MTPQEKQWLESVAGDPAKLRRKIKQHRMLIGVLSACIILCAIVTIAWSVEGRWWLAVCFAIQLAANIFLLHNTRRLLRAAERIEK